MITISKSQRKLAVLIAQDVLKLIGKKSISVEDANAYVYFRDEDAVTENRGKSLKKVISKIMSPKKPCEVCALGACFLAQVARFNQFDLNGGSVMLPQVKEKLSTVFAPLQQAMIESAFERCSSPTFYNHGFSEYSSNSYSFVSKQFGEEYEDPKERLKAIMQNIIANNGVFVPFVS